VVVKIAGGRKCWFYIHFKGSPGTGVARGVVKHVIVELCNYYLKLLAVSSLLEDSNNNNDVTALTWRVVVARLSVVMTRAQTWPLSNVYIYRLTSYIDPHTTSFVNDTQYLVPQSARTVTNDMKTWLLQILWSYLCSVLHVLSKDGFADYRDYRDLYHDPQCLTILQFKIRLMLV
jgi:hypothetical protein